MIDFNYAPYYLRAIERHEVGLKLASGPTGIGKTSVIREVIHSPVCQERKSIYLANRKQLVEDMGKIPSCIILHRDLEVVLITLKERHQAFYRLLDDEELFLKPVHRWNERNPNKRVDLGDVRRACKAFDGLLAEPFVTVPEILEEMMNSVIW